MQPAQGPPAGCGRRSIAQPGAERVVSPPEGQEGGPAALCLAGGGAILRDTGWGQRQPAVQLCRAQAAQRLPAGGHGVLLATFTGPTHACQPGPSSCSLLLSLATAVCSVHSLLLGAPGFLWTAQCQAGSLGRAGIERQHYVQNTPGSCVQQASCVLPSKTAAPHSQGKATSLLPVPTGLFSWYGTAQLAAQAASLHG